MQANDAGNFPAHISAMPDDDKSSFAGERTGRLRVVMKFVKPDFNSPVIGDRIDFYASRHDLPGHLSTDIFFRGLNHILLGIHHSPLVMIKFKIVRIKRGIFVQVDATGIIRGKKDTVLVHNGII